MSRRALIIYFGGLAVLLGALALVAFRPTPLMGFDADDLTRSVNGFLAPTFGACKHRGEDWACPIWDDSGSSAITYKVENPNWWGCWTAKPVNGYSSSAPPKSLSGCITVLGHR